MRTSLLDRTEPSSPTEPAVRRGNHPRVVIAAATLTLLAVAAGSGFALANRKAPSAAPTGVATATTAAATATTVTPTKVAPKTGATAPAVATGAATVTTAALADGSYPAFIRKIDASRRIMVIDLVQPFEGYAAGEAALEDQRSARFVENAAANGLYVRNLSGRLRTLPIAADATVKLLATCEAPVSESRSLTQLTRNATTSESYYYTLTVNHGSVWRIVEHKAVPAC